MKPEQTPFISGWLSIDLPGYRVCDGTYCFYTYEDLPPLDTLLLRGEFDWLPPLDPTLHESMQQYKQVQQEKLQARLDQLVKDAKALGLELPVPFLKFMRAFDWQDQFPSSTACYFDLPERIVRSPLGEGYLIRFLNDQQNVLLWYIYLDRQGEHCVIVSPIPFDSEEVGEIPEETLKGNMAFCGASLEEFLYRYWLENAIWFTLEENQTLTEVQKKYLAHYQT